MSTDLRIFLIVVTLIYYAAIVKSIRKNKLQISFAIFWITSGVVLLIMALFPQLCINISNFLGFETTSNMIFCITIFIAFYLIFMLTIRLSEENKKKVLLIQELSILKEKLEKIEK